MGARVGAQDQDGDTPLHDLVHCYEPARAAQYCHAAQVLLSKGASTSARNRQGITPTALAASKGFTQLEQVLGGGVPLPPVPRQYRKPDPQPPKEAHIGMSAEGAKREASAEGKEGRGTFGVGLLESTECAVPP